MHPRRYATAIVAVVTAACLSVPAAVAAPSRPGDLGRAGDEPVPYAVPAAGTFYPLPVSRILGGTDKGYAVAPGSQVSAPSLGRNGVPGSGVSALMVNVTATAGPSDAGVSVLPTGAAPAAPLVRVPAGQTRSVLLTVPLASASGFDVDAAGGPVSVTADVVGFYAADDTVVGSMGSSGGYQPVSATPVFDTDRSQPLAAGARQVLSVDLGPSANAHATALLVRATAKRATAAGSLTLASGAGAGAPGTGPRGSGTAWATPGTSDPSTSASTTSPTTMSVPFIAGAPATNLALVPAAAAADGRLDIVVTNASTGATGVELDLVGFYDDGGLGPNLRYRPLPQTRVIDSVARVGTSALQPGRPATATPGAAVVGDSTFGLVGVVTAAPAAPADLSLDETDEPAGSFPLAGGVTSSVAVQPEVGAAKGIDLQTRTAAAPLDLTLDVTGSFEAYPPVTNPAARGWVPAVAAWQITAAPR